MSDLDRVVERMRQLGIDLEVISEAPWIHDLEQRFRRQLPPLYRSLVLGFSFITCEIGEVELFGNTGDADEDDVTVAPFRDPHLSPWLIDHGYIHFARPSTGAYDPVCYDVSAGGRGLEASIVRLDHEDILVQRKKVRKTTVAESFAGLVGLS
jgi:hypothetical protein